MQSYRDGITKEPLLADSTLILHVILISSAFSFSGKAHMTKKYVLSNCVVVRTAPCQEELFHLNIKRLFRT